MMSVKEIRNIIWKLLCNGCDCENYPECPEGTNGCIADTLAKAIHKKLKRERR